MIHGEKIAGWRNRPAPKTNTGSTFLADPVFNGRNTGNATRQSLVRDAQALVPLDTIGTQTPTQAQDKRRKLLKAAI